MSNYLSKFIKHASKPTKEIVELLSDITIGTNGAKYSHLHTSNKINTLYKPHFIYIAKNNKALANVTICERPVFVKNRPINSFYIRYFAFKPNLQSKSNATKKPKTRHSFFENYLQELFTTSNLNIEQAEHNRSLFWAYIDPQNNRSLQMGERFGLKTIGYFKTYGFSRFYPKKSKNVSRIEINEHSRVKQMLSEFYKDYAFYNDIHLFKNNDYFVLKQNGKIIAGVQTHHVHWRIDAMPGINGKLAINILPYTPFIRRIINPKNYQFLAVEGLFWINGFEREVEELLESVLAIQQKHSLLMWIDDADDKMINAIQSLKLGLIQKIKSDNSIEIVAKFNQFDKQIKQNILHSKKYISGFDTT
jgi:hypothetical protein